MSLLFIRLSIDELNSMPTSSRGQDRAWVYSVRGLSGGKANNGEDECNGRMHLWRILVE